MRDIYGPNPAATDRDNGLRRLSRLTWRSAQLSALRLRSAGSEPPPGPAASDAGQACRRGCRAARGSASVGRRRESGTAPRAAAPLTRRLSRCLRPWARAVNLGRRGRGPGADLRGGPVTAQYREQFLVGADQVGLISRAEPGAAAGRVLDRK